MAEGVKYRAVTFIAGRSGSQTDELGSKREIIRTVKRILGQAPFGSASSVTMVSPGKKDVLIYQAHVAKRRDGTNYVRSDEL